MTQLIQVSAPTSVFTFPIIWDRTVDDTIAVPMVFPTFDDSLGILTQADLSLVIAETWGYRAENLSPITPTAAIAWSLGVQYNVTYRPFTFGPTAPGAITIGGPGDSTIQNAQHASLPTYDGTLDYAGSSGFTQTTGPYPKTLSATENRTRFLPRWRSSTAANITIYFCPRHLTMDASGFSGHWTDGFQTQITSPTSATLTYTYH